MNVKSNVEREYEAFLGASDRVLKINGKQYHKIIHKDRVAFGNGTVIITIPHALLRGTGPELLVDEKGRCFRLGPACRMHFRGEIPQWYLNSVAVCVDGIHDLSEIGNYLSIRKIEAPAVLAG